MDYLMKKDLRIVCLGGGIGTVNLLRGLKSYTNNITVVVSMADDGGSAGRLRRLYSIPPPGDLINCIAAMSSADPLMKDILTYRFSGNRYGSDRSLPGHKLGNLILVALTSITGDFNKALVEMQKIFKISGRILPSTVENLSIWAKTTTGEKVFREENIDLGRFKGKIDKLYLSPSRPTTSNEVKKALEKADVIIAGPGDLYTTILPVLMVPEILSEIKKSRAHKIFVVNVANKPFETPDYRVADFIQAITRHCQNQLFHHFLVNNNYRTVIPRKYHYKYVRNGLSVKDSKIIKTDLVDESFPLYHDSEKLARKILQIIR
ncbi:YvcK family protein [Candidatus Microgenomates bacterium]|nr:YvcK family protein [Candidatus Microgenomates bacterium]